MARKTEPGIYPKKLADGSEAWRIKFFTTHPVTGKAMPQYRVIRGSYTDAKKARRELLSGVDKGTHLTHLDRMTLNVWVESWLKEYAHTWREKTHERYAELLRRHVLPFHGGKELTALTPQILRTLYATLREEGKTAAGRNPKSGEKDREKSGLSERTILHVHRVLSSCLKQAAEDGKLGSNPCQKIKMKAPKSLPRENAEDDSADQMIALDRDQLGRLLTHFRGHTLYPIVVLAAGTGMRRGEIVALRWKDVNLDTGTLNVFRSLSETRKHGLVINEPKNAASKRTIGITPEVIQVLRAHRAKEMETALALGLKLRPEAPLFRSIKGAGTTDAGHFGFMRPMYVTDATSRITKQITEDPIFQSFTFHDFRHTHTSQLIAARVPITAISKRLGHADPTITLKVYAHLFKESETEALAATSAILSHALPR